VNGSWPGVTDVIARGGRGPGSQGPRDRGPCL